MHIVHSILPKYSFYISRLLYTNSNLSKAEQSLVEYILSDLKLIDTSSAIKISDVNKRLQFTIIF